MVWVGHNHAQHSQHILSAYYLVKAVTYVESTIPKVVTEGASFSPTVRVTGANGVGLANKTVIAMITLFGNYTYFSNIIQM